MLYFQINPLYVLNLPLHAAEIEPLLTPSILAASTPLLYVLINNPPFVNCNTLYLDRRAF